MRMLKHGHSLPLILKAAAGDTAGLLAGETLVTFNSSELSGVDLSVPFYLTSFTI